MDNCLLFLSSLGEISAYSLPDLKCQMKVGSSFPPTLADGNDEGGSSEERQSRWNLKLRLLQHRARPLHVHVQ